MRSEFVVDSTEYMTVWLLSVYTFLPYYIFLHALPRSDNMVYKLLCLWCVDGDTVFVDITMLLR